MYCLRRLHRVSKMVNSVLQGTSATESDLDQANISCFDPLAWSMQDGCTIFCHARAFAGRGKRGWEAQLDISVLRWTLLIRTQFQHLRSPSKGASSPFSTKHLPASIRPWPTRQRTSRTREKYLTIKERPS